LDEVGGSDVVDEAIDEAEAEVTNDFGDPQQRSTFLVDSAQTKYEFRIDNKKTYRIDRVIIREGDNSRRVYTEAASGVGPSETVLTYTWDNEFNTITFSSATISAWAGMRTEVQYVPFEIHHLVRLKGALFLIDNSNMVNSEENTPAIAIRLMNRINRLTKAVSLFQASGSEDNINYDPTYGEYIPQRRFSTY